MRSLEIVLAVLALAAAVLPRRWTGARIAAALALLPVAAVHLTTEGWRWQMVPLYLVGSLLFAVAAWEMLSPATESPESSGLARSLGVIGLAAVVALPAVVPVWELPQPTGKYGIGTVETVITDTGRRDPYDPEGRARRLMLQVWYPADPARDADPEPWLEQSDIVGPAIAETFGFPSFALGHSALIDSHGYSQAAIAGTDEFPVVIYSHGWKGLRAAGLDQIEDLVSHGFIVVAPDHTYGAAATAFPDGELVTYEPSALPEFGTVPDEEYDEAALILVATFAADLGFVMDELERLNGDPAWLLSGRMDLDRIGLFGHSTGGGAVVAICAVDERCDAAVGFDPWVEPVPAQILEDGFDVPFLAIRSEEWLGYDNDPVLQRFALRSSKTDLLGLMGAGHQDFSVLPRFSAVSVVLDLKGSIDSDRAAEIVNTYLVKFFEAELNGGPDVPSDPLFEEVCIGPC
ncbi:MAG: dienelactone hydrolase family protein [Acidimicrobiia bacterium]|nr:dienelactone hydrolase family protein [Acidimicrobiia bacterium]